MAHDANTQKWLVMPVSVPWLHLKDCQAYNTRISQIFAVSSRYRGWKAIDRKRNKIRKKKLKSQKSTLKNIGVAIQ